MRQFIRFNGHLIWMIPAVIGFALCVRRPILILALILMELFSLGLHQFVHHKSIFFGRRPVLVVCGVGTMALLVIAYIYNV